MNKKEGYQDTDDIQIEKRDGQGQIPEFTIADTNKVIEIAKQGSIKYRRTLDKLQD
ncbi:hypothetical protein [Paenibacillus sp. JJ1722]|uniref:hypothetical protein n=1 Tax=Paenibacillus sp. JJ1722 TaxID=3398770 RepID=UPI003AAE2808